MSIIEKIEKSIATSGKVIDPKFDLYLDDNGLVFGYIASETFKSIIDPEAQAIIYRALKDHLSKEELNQISFVMNESPVEYSDRLSKSSNDVIDTDSNRNFLRHILPNGSRCLAFLDTRECSGGVEALYLILIEEKHDFVIQRIEISNDVVQQIGMEQKDAIYDVYSVANGQIESKIKLFLMDKHEALTKEGFYGRYNPFNYVYHNFNLDTISPKDIIFSDWEADCLRHYKDELNNFEHLGLLVSRITLSKLIKKSEV